MFYELFIKIQCLHLHYTGTRLNVNTKQHFFCGSFTNMCTRCIVDKNKSLTKQIMLSFEINVTSNTITYSNIHIYKYRAVVLNLFEVATPFDIFQKF